MTSKWIVKTRFAELYLSASESGLRRVSWQDLRAPYLSQLNPRNPAHAILIQAQSELRDYFAGKLRKFTTPLDLQGTEFQRRVWARLRKIPFGSVSTYGTIARSIGNPRAVRAVGACNARNPLMIVIPCHRVLGVGGTSPGYSGPPSIKEHLIAHEQAIKVDGPWPVHSSSD